MELPEITNNVVDHRYEIRIGEDLAKLSYQKKAGQTIFIHTDVPATLQGRGIGSALSRQAVQDALDEGRWQIPLCPFVRGYLLTHADYQDDPGFYQILAALDEPMQELLVLARGLIVETVPEMVVEVPMVPEQIVGYAEKGGKFTDNLCWLAVRPDRLDLYFQDGRALEDPRGLLADGYVSLRTPADLKNPALRDLILSAWEAVE